MLINDKTEPKAIITFLSKIILYKEVVIIKYSEKPFSYFIKISQH